LRRRKRRRKAVKLVIRQRRMVRVRRDLDMMGFCVHGPDVGIRLTRGGVAHLPYSNTDEVFTVYDQTGTAVASCLSLEGLEQFVDEYRLVIWVGESLER